MLATALCIILGIFIYVVSASPTHAAPWISAYYPGWTQHRLPPSEIDYSAVTHIIHFSIIPQTNGSLNTTQHELTSAHVQDAVTRAHAAGKKILVSVGGASASDGFSGVSNTATRSTLINNLIQFMKTNGYDGIDIDWEPLPQSQGAIFRTFITDLRAQLNAQAPGSMLTVTTMVTNMDEVVPVIQHLDQYNLQTYIISGPWAGWVTWHDSPLFNGGHTFPSNGQPLPSIQGYVNALTAKGVPKNKIGIGSKFGGARWTGSVSGPRQSWTTHPVWDDGISYHTIMDTVYQSSINKWDNDAKVPYISIDNAGASNDIFLSYENEQSLTEKINYLKSEGLGGMIIWELNLGYRPQLPAGQRDPLLKAVKTAVGGGSISPSPTGTNSCLVVGDSNGDGKVTLADYESWRRVFKTLP